MSQKRSAKSQKRARRKQAVRHETGPAGAPPGDEVPDLIEEIAGALAEHPLALLVQVSSLLAALDPRNDSLGLGAALGAASEPALPSAAEFAETFLDVDLPETTAVLHVLGVMADDALLRKRIARALPARRHRLPDWLPRLGEVEVRRAVSMAHVLGDGENVMLGVRLAGGEELTVLTYVDHNLGTVVKDAFAMEEPVDDVVALMVREAAEDPDMSVRELDLADARAMVSEAVAAGSMLFPPLETDSWPAARPLLEWLLRTLPEGGSGFARAEWARDELEELAEQFFASDHGRALDRPDLRDLFESLLWFCTDYSTGDPLRWSPTSVEILLLNWLPRKVMAPPENLALVPQLVRALVRYAHEVLGVRPVLTEETLAAVDRFEPEYLESVGSSRPRQSALDAALGLGVTPPSWEDISDAMTASFLAEHVGGPDALAALDAVPLPDEPFDWCGIAEDVRGRVGEVLELVEAACAEYFDVEIRTACRRFLHRVAVGDPAVFRGKGRVDTAAAAVCWTVGRANDVFTLWGGGPQVQDLMAFFGVRGSPSQRAARLMRAAGIEPSPYGVVTLESADFLEARRRQEIIELRDRLAAQ